MSLPHVRSEVSMAPFQVRSKVCIAPIHVWSKFVDFAPHMDGSIADYAPHMEGIHADLAPQNWNCYFCQISKMIFWNHLYLKSLYDLCDHFWDIKYFEESTFKSWF